MSAWYAIGATGLLVAAAAARDRRAPDVIPSLLAAGSLGGLLVASRGSSSSIGGSRATGELRGVMSETLVDLVALYRLHQTLHWQASGPSYYGDHLLFQRLYEETNKEIDPLAERLVGLFGPDTVDPGSLEEKVAARVAGWQKSPGSAPERALLAEQQALATVARALGQSPDPGTENLLQGFADTHQAHLYLLQQRVKKEGSSSVRRRVHARRTI